MRTHVSLNTPDGLHAGDNIQPRQSRIQPRVVAIRAAVCLRLQDMFPNKGCIVDDFDLTTTYTVIDWSVGNIVLAPVFRESQVESFSGKKHQYPSLRLVNSFFSHARKLKAPAGMTSDLHEERFEELCLYVAGCSVDNEGRGVRAG